MSADLIWAITIYRQQSHRQIVRGSFRHTFELLAFFGRHFRQFSS